MNRAPDSHLENIRNLTATTNHWGWVGGLYLGGNDDGVALRLHAGQGYEIESRRLWMRLCEGGGLAVDVGAHTGIYSLDGWRAGAQVLSVEPYHLNFGRLVLNLRHSGFPVDSCVNCAVSDEEGVQNLLVKTPTGYCSTGGRVGLARPDVVPCPVMTKRLDALLKPAFHANVRAVKIDTEGHGVRVLRGMPQILSYKPDLILECIEEGLDKELPGYRFYVIDEEEGLKPCDSLTPDGEFSFRTPNRFATVRSHDEVMSWT